MRRFIAAILLLLFAAPAFAQDKDFFFRPKDRIVFLGDSITEQYQYSSTIELYLTTRFPNWNLFFLNAGIGGDTAGGGAGRFQAHVLDEKPTAVTINFGMNDGGYGAFNKASCDNYAKNTAKMLEMCEKAGVRVALLSPNAVDKRIDPKRFPLYVETQKQFYAPLKELAEKFGDTFVDQYAITRAALEKMEKDDEKNEPKDPKDPQGVKKASVVPFGDGFHTSSNGGLLMAHAILTGLKAPAIVSDVTIDAAGKTSKTTDAKVEQLTVTEKGLSFDRTDNAIPFPVQKDWVTLLPYVNNLKDLNYYGLRVTGLPAKEYQFSIGGKEVGKYTAAALAEGVNLGNLQTGPLYDQGQKVWAAIGDKNKVVADRFGGVMRAAVPSWLQDVAKERRPIEMKKRLDTIELKQADIYKLVQPTKLRFELQAVGS